MSALGKNRAIQPAVPTGPQFDNRRVAAALIDLLIPLAAAAAANAAGLSFTRGLVLVGIGWTLYYFFALESGGGQTLGKRVMKLRVVSADGSPAGMDQIAKRTLVRILDGHIVGLIVMLATGDRRVRLGDIVAGTVVTDADATAASVAPTEPLPVPAAKPQKPSFLRRPVRSRPVRRRSVRRPATGKRSLRALSLRMPALPKWRAVRSPAAGARASSARPGGMLAFLKQPIAMPSFRKGSRDDAGVREAIRRPVATPQTDLVRPDRPPAPPAATREPVSLDGFDAAAPAPSPPPAPVVELGGPEPLVELDGPEPRVELDRPEPLVELDGPEPLVELDGPEPLVELGGPEPLVEVDGPEPTVELDRPDPLVDIDRPESIVGFDRPEPVVEVDRPEPTVELDSPEAWAEDDEPDPLADLGGRDPVVEVDEPDPASESPPRATPDRWVTETAELGSAPGIAAPPPDEDPAEPAAGADSEDPDDEPEMTIKPIETVSAIDLVMQDAEDGQSPRP